MIIWNHLSSTGKKHSKRESVTRFNDITTFSPLLPYLYIINGAKDMDSLGHSCSNFLKNLSIYFRIIQFPLTATEIHLLKEVYRFFILNYVIKDGRHFFHEIYASKLQNEAYKNYFPSIEQEFNADKLLKALNL